MNFKLFFSKIPSIFFFEVTSMKNLISLILLGVTKDFELQAVTYSL